MFQDLEFASYAIMKKVAVAGVMIPFAREFHDDDEEVDDAPHTTRLWLLFIHWHASTCLSFSKDLCLLERIEFMESDESARRVTCEFTNWYVCTTT